MTATKSPRWELDQALKQGNDTVVILKELGPDLMDRLRAGLQDGLIADLGNVEAMKTGRPVQKQQVKAATGSERELAARAIVRLSRMRDSLKHHAEKGNPVFKAVGVGSRVHSYKTATVLSALQAMILASQNPDYVNIFREAGIIQSDLDQCAAIRDALGAADHAQNSGQGTSRALTREMQAAQMRIEDSVIAVSMAGQMHFLDTDPATVARFAALIPPAPAPKKPKTPAAGVTAK